MDAMVTGRMPAGKKEAGNVVLRDLGITASQAINWLWDYLIAQRQLPQAREEEGARQAKMAQALAFVDGFPELDVARDLKEMDAKQIRAERLDTRHDSLGSGFSLASEEDFR
ncbi:MAG: RelB/DinJ family addiction module antitoxin [Eggerthellaceae bacterium]|nr:RelB/DinJ family addiction module antitoxin [Eggerthellaceae bacterium]